jgi:hypothetical protein
MACKARAIFIKEIVSIHRRRIAGNRYIKKNP